MHRPLSGGRCIIRLEDEGVKVRNKVFLHCSLKRSAFGSDIALGVAQEAEYCLCKLKGIIQEAHDASAFDNLNLVYL